MEIKIVTKHFTMSESVREYVKSKLDNIDRYSHHIISGELILEEERGNFKGELLLKVKGQTLTCHVRAKDVYKVVDGLKNKIKNQLTKYEERLKHR